MTLSKEKMREYQRQRRAKACKPDDVNPVNCKPECKPNITNLDIGFRPCVIGGDKQDYTVPLPANFGLENCQCMHCQQNRRAKKQYKLNHGQHKTSLEPNELNRVSLPGDVDYVGVFTKKDGKWYIGDKEICTCKP